MGTACEDFADAARVDAATLSLFDNRSRCVCGKSWNVRVHFCVGCRAIADSHYHRLCECGRRWGGTDGTRRRRKRVSAE